MSEPQHPQPHDMEPHTSRPLSAAPAAVPAGYDSLAAVGARLAQLREAKGLSVEDVSSRLKVSPIKLRGLEAGDLSQLPDTTFALGVLRSYAKMVGADPAPMTQVLRREKGVPEPALTMPASSGTDLPRGKVSLSLGGSAPRRRSSSWVWVVALIVVVLIALAMWHTNSGDSSAWLARLKGMVGTPAATDNASSPAAEPASNASVTGAIAGSDAQATTANAGAAPDAASGVPMPTPLPMTGNASAAATASAPAAAALATAAASAPKAAASAPAVATAASAAAASEPVAAPAGSSTVALTVKSDSWFSVRQKDGKEVFSGLVHANETKEVSGVPPLKVTVGNKAGLDSITLDGQPVDPAKYASAKGNVARFALP
jgi:cytoskeleton protein RodZ